MHTTLRDFTSGDPKRVYSALWEVIRLRDRDQLDALATSLPEIERATAGVDLGGMLQPNRWSLDFALHKLRYHRDRVGCLCRLYGDFRFYDPGVEADAGNVLVLGTRYAGGRWVESQRCKCTVCGALYEVRHGEAHTPWWEWTPDADRAPLHRGDGSGPFDAVR